METIEITYPDDWHCHLREGPALATTVKAAAKQFKRVVAMPNLTSPLITLEQVKSYRAQINAHAPPGSGFTPLLTLYLTDDISPSLIQKAKEVDLFACKLYPAGVTTHSQSGVTQLERIYTVLEAMQEASLPLLIHGEANDPTIDIFDRERIFIDRHLSSLLVRFPALKIVLEHITTEEAVTFIKEGPSTLAATITPHHLLLNRNDLFVGGIKPHHYCLPILKRKKHQEALISAATSGNPKFFIGTDSAPHAQSQKESHCGCAGIYHPHAIELYAQLFETAGAIEKLAVLVGHNAWFDLHFLNAAITRHQLKSPFHRFTGLDTATLSALAFGQTVLSKALALARIPFKTEEAHSALYDAECTALLFCKIVNDWKLKGGYPPISIFPSEEGKK